MSSHSAAESIYSRRKENDALEEYESDYLGLNRERGLIPTLPRRSERLDGSSAECRPRSEETPDASVRTAGGEPQERLAVIAGGGHSGWIFLGGDKHDH